MAQDSTKYSQAFCSVLVRFDEHLAERERPSLTYYCVIDLNVRFPPKVIATAVVLD